MQLGKSVSWSSCEEVCSWVCQLVGLAVRKCAVGMSFSWSSCKEVCGWYVS